MSINFKHGTIVSKGLYEPQWCLFLQPYFLALPKQTGSLSQDPDARMGSKYCTWSQRASPRIKNVKGQTPPKALQNEASMIWLRCLCTEPRRYWEVKK